MTALLCEVRSLAPIGRFERCSTKQVAKSTSPGNKFRLEMDVDMLCELLQRGRGLGKAKTACEHVSLFSIFKIIKDI